MKKIVLLLVAFQCVVASLAQQSIARFQQNKKWGAIDAKGNVVIQPKYRHIQEFVNGFAVVRQDDNWGAINLKGEEVVKLEFQKVYPFSKEGIARAAIGETYIANHDLKSSEEDKFVYLNTEGQIISKVRYDKTYDFIDGAAIVADGSGKYYVNTLIEEIVIQHEGKAIRPEVFPFSEGLGRIEYRGKYGFIDNTGKQVVSLQYEDAEDFVDGYVQVLLDGKWGIINNKGEVILQPEFEDLPRYTGTGKWFVERRKMGYGVIDTKGEFIPVPENHEGHHKYIDGYMLTEGKKGWGLMNDQCEWVIQPIYEDVKPIRKDGYCLATDKEEEWFFIDVKTGKEIRIPNSQDIGANDLGLFSEGIAAVRTPDNTGFIDSKGKWVVEPILTRMSFSENRGVFSNGQAVAAQGKLYGTIDKKGNWVIQPQYQKMTGFQELEATEEELAAQTTLKGYFKYEKLASDQFAGIKLFVVDDSGDTLATTITDGKGYFEFTNLPRDKNYVILTGEAPDDMEMVVVSPLSNKKRAILSKTNGVFMFTFLGGDEPIALLLMNEEDNTTIDGFFRYQTLAADKVAGLKVNLVDDQGNVILTTTTDANGVFSFKNLDPDKNYMVKIDETDQPLELVLLNDESEEIAVIKPSEGMFQFNYLPSDNSTFLALMEEDDVNMMQGFFSYKTLAADRVSGLKVYLVDDEGNVLMTSLTDEKGQFKFKNLDPDINYFVKIDAADQDMQLVILGDDKDDYAAVMSPDRGGMFLYHELDPDQIAGLSLLYTADDELTDGFLTKTFRGQFRYKHLSPDSLGGLVVHLVDDQGNIVYTATTDPNGMFAFKTLPFDKNYIVKLAEPNADIELLVIGNEGVAAELATNNKGEFVFMKLAKMAVASLMEMDTGGDIALYNSKTSVMAQFKYRLLENSFLAKMAVKVLDEDGKIVGAGTTDHKGRIYFNTFSAGDGLTFQFTSLPSDVNDISMSLYNSDAEMITEVFSKSGSFNYTFLEGDIPENPLLMTEEDMEMVAINKGEVMVKKITDDVLVIYFGFDSDQYNYAENEQLNELLEVLKSDESLYVDISAYSDKSGTMEYNQELSERRSESVTQYLTGNGIRRNRLTSRGLGATNFAVDCDDCTEQQNQLNRRAVLRIN